MTITYVKKLERTNGENVQFSNYSTLRQTDKYQTGVAVLKRKDNKCVAVPLYSWDLTGEALSLLTEGETDKIGDVNLENSKFSQIIDIYPVVSGNEIELMSFLRRYKEKYNVLPELVMEIIRSGLLDFTFFSSPCIPVFKYN